MESLPPPVLGVVSQMVGVISSALREEKETCRIMSGREVSGEGGREGSREEGR